MSPQCTETKKRPSLSVNGKKRALPETGERRDAPTLSETKR
jgi:hypothetical protein